MEKKFTIDICEEEFLEDVWIEKNLTNEFGTWFFTLKRAKHSMVGTISLKPISKFSDDFLNISPKIFLSNTYHDKYSTETTATKVPHQSCFLFGVFLKGFECGYSTYSIKVEIVLSAREQTSKIPTSIDHLKNMYATEKLADIKIKTNNKKVIKAHNFVLSRSPVFDAMLNAHDTKEAQEGVIEIIDFDHDVLVEMIRYLYTDEVPKIAEMGLELLVAGNKYDLPGLIDLTESYLKLNITTANFADLLVTADKFNAKKLKDAVTKYIIENHKTVFALTDWKSLKESNVQLGMEVMEQCFQVLYEKMSK